jgi:hypothetical protein
MTQKQNELLERYADRKQSIKLLEMELEVLEPKVLAYLDKEGVQTLQEAYGTFSVVNRRKYTYTKELVEKQKQYDVIIKAAKQEEQENGEAKVEEVKGLSYRQYEEKA